MCIRDSPETELKRERLSTTKYKNNGGDTANTNNNNKNKLWSKLKSLWS